MAKWVSAAFLMVASVVAPGASAMAAERPVIVELFTSQGCSSCPPAEAALLELSQTRADVLALGFHVDYWDRLGWKDPYSSRSATDRQRAYQRLMGSSSIYTPQAVVDGHDDVLGSDRDALRSALASAKDAASRSVPIELARASDELKITVGAGQGRGTILVVGYDPVQETQVRRGENAGRSILQANVVRSLAAAGEWTGGELKLRVPAPAGERVAVLLQAPSGAYLGATREAARLSAKTDPVVFSRPPQ
ncbi:MAG: DUF1223 domain-containing protein [Methylobacteriaceae bacterium]|nr:DUF1223 domain-containing protein [Methylobacteriaceae bacterium]